jgi:SET domain-containing protein
MRRIVVRSSPVHGRGVFALTQIGAGETILEYKGKRVSWAQAQRQYARSAAEDGHTFYFDLDDGRVIDGAQGGNSARWVNHSCAPNCETEQDGSRVFFHALRDIAPGEELFIDYRLCGRAKICGAQAALCVSLRVGRLSRDDAGRVLKPPMK